MTVTRRDFLKVSGTGAAALSLGGCIEGLNLQAAPSGKKPNILWISTEDISPHLGCYGDKNAVTPNIDRFAKESVRYTRAFTVHGVCAPSRSGIITGMYPSSLGSCDMRCKAAKPETIKCFPEYLRDAGYYCTNNSKEDYNFNTPEQAWDESSRKAHWKNRPENKPFFAVFNFTTTHESKLWDSADFDNTHPPELTESEWQKPENMKIPPIYPDTLAVRRDFARLYERITQFDHFVAKRLAELKEAGLDDRRVELVVDVVVVDLAELDVGAIKRDGRAVVPVVLEGAIERGQILVDLARQQVGEIVLIGGGAVGVVVAVVQSKDAATSAAAAVGVIADEDAIGHDAAGLAVHVFGVAR